MTSSLSLTNTARRQAINGPPKPKQLDWFGHDVRYYSDGMDDPDVRMIRIHTNAKEDTSEWFFAKAEILCGDGTWYDYGDTRLQVEVSYSGYMSPCDEHGVPATPKCSTCGRDWTPAHAKGDCT